MLKTAVVGKLHCLCILNRQRAKLANNFYGGSGTPKRSGP